MNPDSVSVLMTTAHVSGGAPASGPIRHLLSSGIQQFHKVPFIQQDNARPHTARLSQQCLQGYDVPTMACQVTRSFANRTCLERAGKATAAVPRYRRINCADAKTMAGSSTGVISDLIESMPRRISACIAARGGFTTY
ncbi:hypothetical protein TNCV_2235921 [Trichonephila clavipes]|nr:hypothetical protein TNCV_2235921 [Trichonephila clavipes]